MQTEIATKAPANHNHTISDVANLWVRGAVSRFSGYAQLQHCLCLWQELVHA
jgi:hypothetical protein